MFCTQESPTNIKVNNKVSLKQVFPSLPQYFSRTDRLLKHKRTCGEAIKKGLDPGILDLGEDELGQGSYLHTQGNTSAPAPRKRGKAKGCGEGGERRRKKGAAAAATAAAASQMIGMQDYPLDMAAGSEASSSGLGSMGDAHSRAPKLAFKKGARKGAEKSMLALHEASSNLHEDKLLSSKSSPMDLHGAGALDGLGLLHGPSEPKQVGASSNYDDAMQFLKKRRYLHAAGNDYGSVNLQPQQTVIQGNIGEPTLALLDTSPLISIDKHDRSGIPDEVLQSLLDHYSHKADVTFDFSEHHHVDMHAPSGAAELDDGSSVGQGEKSGVMNEYSKFLLQTLERTSHGNSAGFAFFPDKHIYTATPLECNFVQSVPSPHTPSSSSSSSSSALPKSHFSMLVGSQSPSHASPSSQQAFHLSALEPGAHQQLTPSQELTEQLEKSHSPSYAIATQDLNGAAQKEQQIKNAGAPQNGPDSVYPMSSNLATLETSKEVDVRPTYQIENFAQAFGSQFKSGRRTPLGYGSETQQRTPVSEFSGYTSLLADVGEPASSGTKTPTSQSYR